MNLGQLLHPGQVSDPGINFPLVYCLMRVTVHLSFSLSRGIFERQLARCITLVNQPCRGNLSPYEQNGKVVRGKNSTHYCTLIEIRNEFFDLIG